MFNIHTFNRTLEAYENQQDYAGAITFCKQTLQQYPYSRGVVEQEIERLVKRGKVSPHKRPLPTMAQTTWMSPNKLASNTPKKLKTQIPSPPPAMPSPAPATPSPQPPLRLGGFQQRLTNATNPTPSTDSGQTTTRLLAVLTTSSADPLPPTPSSASFSVSPTLLSTTSQPATPASSHTTPAPSTSKKSTKHSPLEKAARDKQKQEAGRRGEQHVYDTLKADYLQQGYELIEDNPAHLGCRLKHPHTAITVNLIWCNRHGESGYPYDLVIRTQPPQSAEDIQYIEVKSTPKAEPTRAIFSGDEVRTMGFLGAQYSIRRVYNALADTPSKPQRIENPYPQYFAEDATQTLLDRFTEFSLKI